jgi:hypothetical protein
VKDTAEGVAPGKLLRVKELKSKVISNLSAGRLGCVLQHFGCPLVQAFARCLSGNERTAMNFWWDAQLSFSRSGFLGRYALFLARMRPMTAPLFAMELESINAGVKGASICR